MGGGRGDLAFHPKAKKLDNSLKNECQSFLKKRLIGFNFKKKLYQEEIPGEIGACEPDAGIFENDTTVVVMEAKHQQDGGNANDRWHKNNRLIHKVYKNKRVIYITICSGEGAYQHGALMKSIHFVHCLEDGVAIDLKDVDSLHECVPGTSFNIAICSILGYSTDDLYNICEVVSQLVTNN